MSGEIPNLDGNAYKYLQSKNQITTSTATGNENIADAIHDLAKRVQVENIEKAFRKNTGYKLGYNINGIRKITVDSVRTDKQTTTINFGGIQLTLEINHSKSSQYSNTTDNYIGDSNQAIRGDCFFLAEINAIRNTKNGQKVLTQNLKMNNDGSYTVTLPGALIIKQKYKTKGLPCHVTGRYHISKAALEKAGASKYYSKGDLEVVALELALEAYRAEMYLTNKANNTKETFGTAEGGINSHEISKGGDLLHGGQTHDAAFLLTGEKSDAYFSSNKKYNSVKPYKDGQYGYITRQEMARRTNADISMYKCGLGISEFSNLTRNDQAINSMLSKYENKEGQYALTFGVRVAKNGTDGTTKAGGGHAMTIVKITKNIVYIANPWHPDKIEPIPRHEFIKMATLITATPIKSSTTPNNTIEIPQSILDKITSYRKK